MSRPNSNPKPTEVEDEILDAAQLTEDDLADFCSDEEHLPLIVERKGKKVKFTLTVNPQLVTATDLALYRKSAAALSLQANQAKTLAEALPLDEGDGSISSPQELELVEQNIDIQDEMASLKATLLAKLIVRVTPPLPGKTLDAQTLQEREGVGYEARKVLDGYFFVSLTPPEEETGESETPSTETSAATSEPAETTDATPATS